MTLSTDQRRTLGAFLRARREALRPAEAGIVGLRRRTSGLRREEVAQGSGISTTWYTWIEQGRDISVSALALSRLAQTLRLQPAERAYLFELVRMRDPAPPRGAETAPSELLAAVAAVAAPCYLLDRLWCARGWNPAARHLFAPWLGGTEPCLLRFVFLDPAARVFIDDWDHRARRLLAEFRADTVHHPDDAALQALIGTLRGASVDFARFWDSQTVLDREGGTRRFNHPEDGALIYEQLTLIRPGHPEHKLVLLLPQAAS